MKSRLFAFVVLFPLLLHGAGFCRSAVGMTRNPYQLDYGEGIVLYQASRITDRAAAYKPITSYPFIVFHYPPVYHWSVKAVSGLTGNLLTAGRTVSIVAGALTAVVIGLLVYFSLPNVDVWRRRTAALFAGMSPSLLVVMLWTSLARVDMLAVLLSFIGLAAFVLGGRRARLGAYLAFLCFVLAVFTKQTAIAAPVACLIATVAINPRHAAHLLAFACGVGGVLLASLTWWTHGGVLRHLFLYNQNTFSVGRMVQGLSENMLIALPVVGFAALYVGVMAGDVWRVHRMRRWRKVRAWLGQSRIRRLGFVASLMLVVAMLVSLTYGKTGSNFNYFIEWNLTSCLLAGLALYRCWDRRWCVPLVALVTWMVPVVILLAGLPSGLRAFWPSSAAVREHGVTQTQAHRTLVGLVRATPGPVLSENMLVLIEAGKDVPAEPAILRELATNGAWDERLLTDRIFNREFDLIITVDLSNRVMYTQSVAEAIEASYRQARQVAQYEVYEPRGRD